MAGLLGSGARVGVAAWGCAGCWPRGVTAPTTASPAAAPMLGWSASARWPVLARCPIQAPNAGSTASSVPWSAREAKVPGHDPSGAAIQGRGRVRLATARAGALRRARPPRRREGFLCVRERGEKELRTAVVGFCTCSQVCEKAGGSCVERTGETSTAHGTGTDR